MSTRAILIQWGIPVPGRERLAIEEFSSYMQWANRLKADRRIERFEVYGPKDGTYQQLAGLTLLEGSDKQIDELADSDEFRARIQRVITVTQSVHVDRCDVGEAFGKRMQGYASVVQDLKL